VLNSFFIGEARKIKDETAIANFTTLSRARIC
jgi:hypothetical protein